MKTDKEIRELIKSGETHNIEFKAKFDPDKIGQAICALSNDWPSIGDGTLLVGIDDKKRSLIGLTDDRDKLQREISDICRSSISPEIAPVIHFVELDKPVLVVEISTSSQLPVRYKNHCYIRVGTSTRVASFYEELTLYKRYGTKTGLHKLEDKLPKRDQPIEFKGREKELADLWSWFKDSKSFRCALSGDGGKGKTATAYEFAQRIAEAAPEPYELVLWASAKQRQFIQGETVPISDPDFKDFSSLLDKLLIDLWLENDVKLTNEEKGEKVLEFLTAFPALIIIDDLDSLDWTANNDTLEFITYNLPHTKSKVLITTRTQIPSILPIVMEGFSEEDGIKFIDSRLRLSGMASDTLTLEMKQTALKVADSSPLYLEDILRLFVITADYENTISQWKSHGGKEARSYAVKREFELLSTDAKHALLAFSVLDEPATSAEAKAITGLTWARWNDAVSELQRLFLIPRPGIIEGLHRFSLNSNTKTLVLSNMEGSPELAKFKQNLRNISGQSYFDSEKRKSIGSLIRQANANIREKSFITATQIIEAGIKKLGEDPDLIGALGLVYKCSIPSRVVDAREKFRRSAELKCNNHEMYNHWYEMEDSHEYFNESMEAARAALVVFPSNLFWLNRLAYATGRYGELLIRQFQPRGRIYLGQANKILERLIHKIEVTLPDGHELHRNSLKSLVLNYAALYNSATEKEKDKYCNQFANSIKWWREKFPDDPGVDYQSSNLLRHYPEVKRKYNDLARDNY
jgi:hypothetical protein